MGRWFIPGPQVDGTQALAFGPAGSLSAEGATLLAMAAAVGLGWLITWPDAPHTGTFCACAGLLALAVHWGGLNLLLVDRYSNLPAVYADPSGRLSPIGHGNPRTNGHRRVEKRYKP